MSNLREHDNVAVSEQDQPSQQNYLGQRGSGPQRRGRERDAESAKRAILAAAEETFAREGFAGARVDAIAEASGYNKALLFHYFGDKLGLYREVVCLRRDESAQLVCDVLLEATGDPNITPDRAEVRAFVEKAVGWMFDHLAGHEHFRQMLAWEAADGWQTFRLVKQQSNGQMLRWVQPVRDFIQRAQKAGIVRSDLDAKMLIMHVMGMPLIYLLSIPRYEAMFAGEDLSSRDAMAHAREQMIRLAVYAIMTDPEEN